MPSLMGSHLHSWDGGPNREFKKNANFQIFFKKGLTCILKMCIIELRIGCYNYLAST